MNIEYIIEGMKKFKFDKMEWDGEEVTMYDEHGPHSPRSFIPESPTRIFFEELTYVFHKYDRTIVISIGGV